MANSIYNKNVSPFCDARYLWNLFDLNDVSGNNILTPHGNLHVGIQLSKLDLESSNKRGGDGYIARFQGGYLSFNQETEKCPKSNDKTMSIYLRIQDPLGKWDSPLLSKYCNDGKLAYRLFSNTSDFGKEISFELATDWNERPLRVSVPIEMIGSDRWHDVIICYRGSKLELFIDGVLVDEEWPIGTIKGDSLETYYIGAEYSEGNVKSGFHGDIDHLAIWDRVLSYKEILIISGGEQEVFIRESEILGPETPIKQYWKPRGYNTNVGDCMPFFHDGKFHLFYLFDRRHHGSKWGLGAHQWAHSSTTDLINWENHPMAVPITEEWEGSICTGSTFFNDGRYFCFYATRMSDGSAARLSAAISQDGIHFKKGATLFTLNLPYKPGPARDPKVFQDKATGLFYMLVTTELENPAVAFHGGCLALFVSKDLAIWEQKEPFIIPGYTDQPECSDYFFWNGWYYLIFSNNGMARYRMSREPMGPWLRPEIDVFDGPSASVLKTAPFIGDRRIGAAFLGKGGWGGNVVFREIIQHADGTLGTKFPDEMITSNVNMPDLKFDALTDGVLREKNNICIRAWDSFKVGVLSGLPKNMHIRLRVKPERNSSYFGLCLRGSGDYQQGNELRFEPYRQKVGLRSPKSNSIEENERASIYNVKGLDKPFSLDIIAQDDIIDICIDNRRTLVNRFPILDGNRLFFFAQNGAATFELIDQV